jgi:NADP-dependent 3-hydroxy acid dehydrogenase YdfG
MLRRMTTNLDLTGRTAVVTGATAGIGEATARAFLAAGASVALVGRRAERLERLAAEYPGGRALPVPADVTDPASVEALVAAVHGGLGPVDLVVANAGLMLGAPFPTADPGEWRQMLDVNLGGLLATGRAFVEDLLAAGERGAPADLVHVGSIASRLAFVDYAVYCGTKAAVDQLTRGLRLELGPRGVRVRNVEPGFTMTELGDGMLDDSVREALAGLREATPPLSPEAIADAILYTVAAPVGVNVAHLEVVPVVQG